MSYYDGDKPSASITLATRNPYDGGITAHEAGDQESVGASDTDASFFDDFGGEGADGGEWQEAAAGIGELEQAAAGYDDAGQSRAYSGMQQAAAGYDNAGQNRAYSGMQQVAAGYGAIQRYAPAAMQQAAAGYDNAGQNRAYSGIPARMYSGFGNVSAQFDPAAVWADILRSNEKSGNSYTQAAQAAGARWASSVKTALSALGYGATDPSLASVWTDADVRRYADWATRSGLTPTSWGVPAKDHLVVLARQVEALEQGGAPSAEQSGSQPSQGTPGGGTQVATYRQAMFDRARDAFDRASDAAEAATSSKAVYWTVGLLALGGVAAFAYYKTKKKSSYTQNTPDKPRKTRRKVRRLR